MRDLAVKQNRKPRACPSKAEQCLFVHPCACTLFSISLEAKFPTDWGVWGVLLQHAWHDNSHPELLTDKLNRLHCLIFPSLENCYFSRPRAWIQCIVPLFLPSADGHPLSFPFRPSIFLSEGQFEAGKPRRRDCQGCVCSPGGRG